MLLHTGFAGPGISGKINSGGEKLTWFLGVFVFWQAVRGRVERSWVPLPLRTSDKRGEACDGGPGAGGEAAGRTVERALLARGVRRVLGRWGPTGLGPEEAALLGAAAVGESGVVRLARVALRVAVGLGPRDALLLPAPGVVIGGVADVVVDERVGLLVARVNLVLAVASLGGQRTRGGVSNSGDGSARSGLGGA